MPTILARAFQRFYGSPTLLLGLCTLMWGGNAVVGRLAVGEITPFTMVFLRWVLVLSVLWPIYGRDVEAHWKVIRPKIIQVVAMGTLGFTAFNALFYVAGHYTSAINIGILQGSIPAIVLAGALVMHGTRVTMLQIIGVIITMAGVVVVATRGQPETILGIDFNFGDLLMLIACIIYALYTVALRSRPAMPGTTFFTLLAVVATYTSVPLFTFEVLTTGFQMPTPKGFALLAFVAIFPSYLAQIFFLRGVDLIGPGRAGVYVNLVPIFAALLAVGILGETFALYHAVALGLVLSGILLSQRQPAPKAKPTRQRRKPRNAIQGR